MADPKAIEAALRRQTEAKAVQKARSALTIEERIEEARQDPIRKPWYELINDGLLTAQFEGFLLGWLAATGKFDEYRELAEIWLDTPKNAESMVSSHSEVADPIKRFNARLNLPKPRGKRSRS